MSQGFAVAALPSKTPRVEPSNTVFLFMCVRSEFTTLIPRAAHQGLMSTLPHILFLICCRDSTYQIKLSAYISLMLPVRLPVFLFHSHIEFVLEVHLAKLR